MSAEWDNESMEEKFDDDGPGLPEEEVDSGWSEAMSGVFFTSNPHMDPLMPSFLDNGHELRYGIRPNERELYPLLDWILRILLHSVILLCSLILTAICSKSLHCDHYCLCHCWTDA